MKIQLASNYSQFDPSWKDLLLGFNTDPQYNFYNYACLLCCLANVSKYYGKDETPLTLNDKLKQAQGYVNGGEYVHGVLGNIYHDITERWVNTPEPLSNEQMQDIKNALDQGYPVVVGIDYNPKTIKPDWHFVTLIDYDPNNENNFTVADSLGGRVHSLRDYLGWYKPSARATIESYCVLTGPVPQVQEVPASEPVQTPVAVPTPEPQVAPLDVTLRHGSDQWDQTVSYLELERDPKDANFEDVKRVIAGIKSRQTDLNNQKVEADKRAAEFAVTIENQKEDINRLKEQVLRSDKLHKAEIDGLKSNTPTFDNLKKQYEGVFIEMTGKLTELSEEAKTLRIALAHKAIEDGEIDVQSKSDRPNIFQNLAAVLVTIFKLRW